MMPYEDEIIAEIRRVRDAHAAQFNYDVRAMGQDLRQREQQSGHPLVSFPPKPAQGPPPEETASRQA